jgi:SAM-dependent methyltransferase
MTDRDPSGDEARRIIERYVRRPHDLDAQRYSPLEWSSLLPNQERVRAVVRVLRRAFGREVRGLRLVDVGCGSGQNLLEFLRLGFSPGNLAGIDLLADRIASARERLPTSVSLALGDATTLVEAHRPAGFDIAYFGVVFSSILNPGAQEALASEVWSLLRSGGGVMIYDFAYDNPANPDVKGLTSRRARALFPQGRAWHQWLTLAPPIARRAVAVHPLLYGLLNCLPLLRTHRLHWIEKV